MAGEALLLGCAFPWHPGRNEAHNLLLSVLWCVCVSACFLRCWFPSHEEWNGISSGTFVGCLADPVDVANVYTFHYLPMVQ